MSDSNDKSNPDPIVELQKAVYAVEDQVGDLCVKLSFLMHAHERLGRVIVSLNDALASMQPQNSPMQAKKESVSRHPPPTHRSAWSA